MSESFCICFNGSTWLKDTWLLLNCFKVVLFNIQSLWGKKALIALFNLESLSVSVFIISRKCTFGILLLLSYLCNYGLCMWALSKEIIFKYASYPAWEDRVQYSLAWSHCHHSLQIVIFHPLLRKVNFLKQFGDVWFGLFFKNRFSTYMGFWNPDK